MMTAGAPDVIYCIFDPARPGPYEPYLLPHIPVEARRERLAGWLRRRREG